MSRIIPVILTLVLAACATVMPPTPLNQSGTLVVYQPLTSHSDSTEPYLYVDNYRVGRLGIGAVESVRLAAGHHRIAVREALLFWPGQESAVAEVTIGVGQKTWLRFNRAQIGVNVDTSGTRALTRPTLDEVDAMQGESRQ